MTAQGSRLVLLFVVVVIGTAFGWSGAPAAHAQAGGLRSVDWAAVLASEPGIRVNADCLAALPDLQARGICIDVRVDPPQPVEGSFGDPVDAFTGVAVIAPDGGGPLYGDIDGDGVEEAIIETVSGGTGGSFGFLVYQQGAVRPRLVAAVPGYKTFVAIQDGLLAVDL